LSKTTDCSGTVSYGTSDKFEIRNTRSETNPKS
jgi:hypothetical protein